MYLKWTDENIRGWVACYLSHPDNTLETLENEIGISHSTLWWCFTHRLEFIDYALYEATLQKLENNIHKRGKRKCSQC